MRLGPLARLLVPLLALSLLATLPAQAAQPLGWSQPLTSIPVPHSSERVSQTLPSNWARYNIMQHDVYQITVDPGELEVAVPSNVHGGRAEVILYDYLKDKVLMDRLFSERTGATFRVTISETGPLRLFILDNRLQSLILTGEGLTIRPGTPAVSLPVAPYTTWNAPQTVQAELRNPSETELLELYLGNNPISTTLLQPDGSVAPATVDTSGLADGIYDLVLAGLANSGANEGLMIRPILVDRTPAFADVPTEHWAHHPIEVMFHEGIVGGKAPGQFSPEDSVTRAEFAKMLAATIGLQTDPAAPNPFVDVPDDWARPYILAVYQAGLVRGEEADGHLYFRPDRTISRAEATTIIARELGLDGPTDAIPSFSDWASVPDWAKSSVANLVEQRWLQGFPDGTFRPEAELARAEAAKILAKFLGL